MLSFKHFCQISSDPPCDEFGYFLELYTLPSSSLRFAGDETPPTIGVVVLSGFSETLFSSFIGVIVADDPIPVFTGSFEFTVLVVDLWVVGAWVEFNATGLLDELPVVIFVRANWLPTPLLEVGLDALLDNADELLPVKNKSQVITDN